MKSSIFILATGWIALAMAGCGAKQTPQENPSAAFEVAQAAPEMAEPEPDPEPTSESDPVSTKQEAAPPKPPPTAASPAPVEITKARVTDKKIIISGKVMFEYNKANIMAESHSLINGVADALKKHPEIVRIRIEGHTDSDGDDTYNKRLSQKRASSVRNYLLQAGIRKDRMIASGYGESIPITSNDDAAGRAKNRRVEFTILERANPKAVTWSTSTRKPNVIKGRAATDKETEEAIQREGK